MDRFYFVYILASGLGGTLYIGITNDLQKRVGQHVSGTGSVYTAKYDVKRLVYFEPFDDVRLAQKREKQIKRWKRSWKVRLIEERNPNWEDLSRQLL